MADRRRALAAAARPLAARPLVASAALVLRDVDALARCEPAVALVSAFLDASSRWDVARGARHGLLHLLRHLHLQAPLATPELACALQIAASAGHLGVIHWIHSLVSTASGDASRDNPFSVKVMNFAACYGRLDVVAWLHANRTEGCTTKAMDGAACCGHEDVVRFLHTHRHEGCTSDAMDSAAINGHVEIVAFFHANRSEGCTTRAMDVAAMNGDLPMLRFLHTHRQEGCSVHAVRNAARGSRIHHSLAAARSVAVLQFLYEHYRELFTPRELQYCVRVGPSEVVAWVQTLGLVDVEAVLSDQQDERPPRRG